MNAGTQTARSAPLSFVAAKKDQTRNAGSPVDFQELCSFAMDQALGIEKASLATLVSLNSSLLDISESSLWFTPVFGNLIYVAAQAVACSIELQMSWFSLLSPQHAATPGRAVAGNAGEEAQPTAEELAQGMDIAIGEQFAAPRSTVTGISGGQAHLRADVLERSMDIAIGIRAA